MISTQDRSRWASTLVLAAICGFAPACEDDGEDQSANATSGGTSGETSGQTSGELDSEDELGSTSAPIACDSSTPFVSWETFGEGFMNTYCQGCHASTTPDRQNAPADVMFDSEADVWGRADRVLATVTGETTTMPPSGGPSDDEKELLRIWLTCNEG